MITIELTEDELADLLAAFDSYTQFLTATRERWIRLGGLRDKLAAVTRAQQ